MVDTSNSDHKEDFAFGRNIERVFSSGLSSQTNELFLLFSISRVVSLAALKSSLSSSSDSSSLIFEPLSSAFSNFGVSISLLDESFRDLCFLSFLVSVTFLFVCKFFLVLL